MGEKSPFNLTIMTLAIILFVIGILILFFGNNIQNPEWDLLGFILVITSFGYVLFQYYSLAP